MGGKNKLRHIKQQFFLLGFGWTILIACAAIYSYFHSSQTDIQLATLQAKTAFAKDIIYRRWNASKGGLYVPISKATPPTPYLTVNSRDITSPEIGKMTLVNPSYMTRQVHDLERQELGVRSHITSLQPIRPSNEADPWEAKALKRFEVGEREIFSLEQVDGAPFLRYMKPLFVESACLKCHEEQGYKLGDIRGGISVSVPMVPLRLLKKGVLIRSGFVFSIIWLSGIIGILVAHSRISVQMQREDKVYREKEEMGAQLLQAQKMEAIGQMAAGIAHEINTPIQYLSTNIEFLKESFRDISEFFMKIAQPEKTESIVKDTIKEELSALDWEYLSEEIPTSLKQSSDGLANVSGIVQAMKVFSHPGSKEKADSEINEVINNVITVSQNEWKYSAEMKTDLAPGLTPIPIHVNEMRQVFLNIINNAVHAIKNKQRSQGNQEKGVISIKSQEDKAKVEIQLSDTGTGIPQEDMDRIFDLFFTTKEVGSGTGQGLYICYDIVTNKHGGELLVESQVDIGTTFTIRLPKKTPMKDGFDKSNDIS